MILNARKSLFLLISLLTLLLFSCDSKSNRDDLDNEFGKQNQGLIQIATDSTNATDSIETTVRAINLDSLNKKNKIDAIIKYCRLVDSLYRAKVLRKQHQDCKEATLTDTAFYDNKNLVLIKNTPFLFAGEPECQANRYYFKDNALVCAEIFSWYEMRYEHIGDDVYDIYVDSLPILNTKNIRTEAFFDLGRWLYFDKSFYFDNEAPILISAKTTLYQNGIIIPTFGSEDGINTPPGTTIQLKSRIASVNKTEANLELETRASARVQWEAKKAFFGICGFYLHRRTINKKQALRVSYHGTKDRPTFPDEIFELEGVEELSFKFSRLRSIPEGIEKLQSLKVLNLSFCTFSSFPVEILDLTNLQELYIRQSHLKEIPSGIKKLKNLKILDLRYNELKSLPNEFFSLPNLEELYLNNNQLAELPSGIDGLKQLQILHLHNNAISSLPNNLFDLSNLKTLNLSNNLLNSVPITTAKISNLKTLNLDNNQLLGIPVGIGALNKLSVLSIKNNRLVSLPKEIFSSDSLRKLSLDNNMLKRIPASIKNVPALEYLSLRNNKIESIPDEILAINKLYLRIDGNQLLPNEIIRFRRLINITTTRYSNQVMPQSYLTLQNLNIHKEKERIKLNKIKSITVYEFYYTEDITTRLHAKRWKRSYNSHGEFVDGVFYYGADSVNVKYYLDPSSFKLKRKYVIGDFIDEEISFDKVGNKSTTSKTGYRKIHWDIRINAPGNDSGFYGEARNSRNRLLSHFFNEHGNIIQVGSRSPGEKTPWSVKYELDENQKVTGAVVEIYGKPKWKRKYVYEYYK